MYKIRNKNTGFYSSGGIYVKWRKPPYGKTWKTLAHLKQHLQMFATYDWPYDDSEVVHVGDIIRQPTTQTIIPNILEVVKNHKLQRLQ